jgi:hypothetical protein
LGAGGGVGLLGEGANGAGGSNAYTGGYAGGGANGDGAGNDGGVRIIWPGLTRQFPSTNTGNL